MNRWDGNIPLFLNHTIMKQNKDKSWLEQLVKNYRIPNTDLGNKPLLTEVQRKILNQSKSK